MANSDKRERFDWYTDHPVREQMKEWGFKDSSRVHAAFTVYLDLCEAKTWWNVSVHPCQELEMVYITGKPDKKADVATVLPLRAHEEISLKLMDDFLRCIPPPLKKEKPEGSDVDECLEEKGHVITLAVVEADSTVVYYNISNDLQQPKNLIQEEEEETTAQRKKKIRKLRWNAKRKDTS